MLMVRSLTVMPITMPRIPKMSSDRALSSIFMCMPNDATHTEGVAYRDGGLDIDLHRDNYDDVIQFFRGNYNHKSFSLRGVTVFFGYALRPPSPDVFSKQEITEKRNGVRSLIKNYPQLPSEQQTQIVSMVDTSLKYLNEDRPLQGFDLIVSVESTAPFNKLLVERIKPLLRQDAMVVDNLFAKDTIDKLDLDWEMLDREPSELTKEMVLTMYEKIMKSGKPFFIKDLKSSARRYFTKFLKFRDDTQKQTFEHIFGKSILLLDDTVGEAATFTEMLRLISTYKPKESLCFAFLKDY
jgi:hypothetical protein